MLNIKGTESARPALFAALAAAQSEFLPIARNKTVKVRTRAGDTYSFDYADLEEIISKTRPALTKNGLSLMQTLGEKETKDDANRTVVIGVITTALMHSGGAYIEDEQTFSIGGTNQEMGADITYKRRYSASCVLMIAAETDDDGGTGPKSKAENREVTDRPAGQRREMNPKDATADEAQVIANFKTARSINELTGMFNTLPAEMRRPGTNVHEAFQAKRAELMKPAPADPKGPPDELPLGTSDRTAPKPTAGAK